MTEWIFLFLLLMVNTFIVMRFFKTIYAKEGLASPITFILGMYLLSYPMRAIMLFVAINTDLVWDFNIWEYSFDRSEILIAFFYSTLFMGCIVFIYSKPYRRKGLFPECHRNISTSSGLNTAWQRRVFLSFYGAYILAFLYDAATGGLSTLYESIEDLQRPFWVNLLSLSNTFKWFLLAYAFLRIQRVRSLPDIIVAFSITATILIRTFVSTGKGDLVALTILVSLCVWIVRGRIPKGAFVLGTIVAIVFAFYSFTARQHCYSAVRAGAYQIGFMESSLQTMETVAALHRSNKNLWLEQVGYVFSRFDGMDGLTLCLRLNPFLGEGLYTFGSLVELGNLIPRMVWPTRPHLSFNHFVTNVVWGKPGLLSETPIGRIGESFYVLNWAGFFYAVFYAILWKWLYRKFFIKSNNDISIAFYIWIIMLVIPDAYLFYNLKQWFVVMFSYILLLSKGFVLGRPRTAF